MSSSAETGWIAFLKSKEFRKTLIALFLFFAIMVMVAFLWLRMYTHHGQKLVMPDYVGVSFEKAEASARKSRFRMSVQDSIHVLGRPGGEILKQNPVAGSHVKENRMIYVTVTKHSPDKISSSRLPELYGKNFTRKKRELEEHFEIKCREVEKRYDPGEPGQILEVRYKGKIIINAEGRAHDIEIEKGDYLDVVVSDKQSRKISIPNLECKTFEEAQFFLENNGLVLGEVTGDVSDEEKSGAYIIRQSPAPGDEEVDLGSPINVVISVDKPSRCE